MKRLRYIRHAFGNAFGKKARLAVGAAALVIILSAVFFFSYFQITKVTVVGNQYYSEDEIKKIIMQGPMSDNSVILLMQNTEEKIKSAPFIKTVSVKRVSSHEINIFVTEKQLIGYVKYLDGCLYFDKNGIVQVTTVEPMEKTLLIEGIEFDKVETGEKLPGISKKQLNTVLSLCKIIQKNEIRFDKLFFKDNGQIVLYYGEIEIRLGEDENLDDKMNRLMGILPSLEGKKGVLHLENVTEHSHTITFEEEKDPEEAPENPDNQTEGDGNSGEGYYNDGSYDDGSYDDGSYDEGYYDDGSYDDGSYDEGYYDDGSYDEGYYDDGSYDEGYYDDGSYDDGSYNDNYYE